MAINYLVLAVSGLGGWDQKTPSQPFDSAAIQLFTAACWAAVAAP